MDIYVTYILYIYSYIHIQPIYPPSCEEPMVSLGYYLEMIDFPYANLLEDANV